MASKHKNNESLRNFSDRLSHVSGEIVQTSTVHIIFLNTLSLSLFSFLPVLRFELAFVTVKLRRNATFLLLMTSPTVLGLIKLSTLATLVKAYLGFLVESLWIRIRNGLIGVRRILLLHQLNHHQSRELL